MRAVAQRVRDCSVVVDDETVAAVARGLLVYLGVTHKDTRQDAEYLAEKIVNLRVFADAQGKMNRSVAELGYEIVVVSQFTLYGDVRRGRRPSYDAAARPEQARELYQAVIDALAARGVPTFGGRFQARMEVSCVNEGPVTILIDSQKQF